MYRLLLALAAAAASLSANAQDAPMFTAGAATSNITPPLGISIAGHMHDRKAIHIHDELHVRCLVLDDGTTQLAFAVIDSCMVPRDLLDAAKAAVAEKTGIAPDHQLMSATHTHTGPCATPVFQSDPDPAYNAFLTQRIVDGVVRAHNNMRPARIAWGKGSLPGEVFNRRWLMKPGTTGTNPFGKTDEAAKMNPPRASEDMVEPAGPTDPDVSFVAVETREGEPLGLLANYSLHYVGNTGPDEISADYFGIFCDEIARLLEADGPDPRFVAMMSNGTSGNINNIDSTKPGFAQKPYEQMTIVAKKAAAEVFAAYQSLAWNDWVKLAATQTELTLGVRKPNADELADAKAVVSSKNGGQMDSLPEIYARESVLLAEYPDTVDLLVQAVRIGDCAIATTPCETFVETGLAIKAASPFGQTFTIELANGYNGYLPTPEHHALGGYETWRARSSYLVVDAEPAIRQAAIDALATLFDKP